jgi:hypothetical protein
MLPVFHLHSGGGVAAFLRLVLTADERRAVQNQERQQPSFSHLLLCRFATLHEGPAIKLRQLQSIETLPAFDPPSILKRWEPYLPRD